MKTIIKITALAGFLFSASSFARFSCDDLDDMAASLDDMAYEFERVDEQDIDRRTDRALRELVETLNLVAQVENDMRLTTWIRNLQIAFEDKDKDDFEEALDDIIDRMDDLYERDCER